MIPLSGPWVVAAMLIIHGPTGPEVAKRAIQAQYDRWSRAYMARDADTLLDILSPDYTLTTADKDVLTYPVYKAQLKLRKALPKDDVKYRTEIRSLNLRGNEAEVDSVESMTSTVLDAKRRRVIAIHRHEYLDTWRKVGASWKLARTVTLRESTTTQKGR